MRIIPGILCGGSGTRLWPMSRTRAPKQLQPLVSDKSLLAETVLRLTSHPDCLPPILICGASYVDEIEAQMANEDAPLSALLVEPMGRDTAAAAAVAAHWVKKRAEADGEADTVLLLLPSDHHIADIDAFHSALSVACNSGLRGSIATLGIIPRSPETGFGYIRREEHAETGLECFPVAEFVEKPPLKKAEAYLRSGNYLWNAGMFAFRPETFLSELTAFEPDIASASEAAFEQAAVLSPANGPQRVTFRSDDFSAIPKKSIDFAVMEHTQKATVVPADIGWSDVGSWSTLYDIGAKDRDGNVIEGQIIAADTSNSLLRASPERVVSVIGLSDVVVIDTPDATLVSDRARVQDVKSVHAALQEKGHPAADRHSKKHTSGLVLAKAWAKQWMLDIAVPFWADTGIDPIHGGAVEALSHEGVPLTDRPKRTRVQARQTYVFAHAALMGVSSAHSALENVASFMLSNANLGNGRFADLLAQDGEVIDERQDSYNLAFIMFSLAWLYKVSGDEAHRAHAMAILDQFETSLRHHEVGFVEGLPKPDWPRRANSHMHLLEACLAWADLHGEQRMFDVAEEITGLFDTRFRKLGLLREFFKDDLSDVTDEDDGKWLALEPGHLCEWAYLRTEVARLTGKPTPSLAAMDAFVETYGRSTQTGLILDQVDEAGFAVTPQTSRLWPQTEYLRWKMVRGTEKDTALAAETAMRLRAHYLMIGGKETGYWKDHLDAEGNVISKTSPTSSMYHLMTGLSVLF